MDVRVEIKNMPNHKIEKGSFLVVRYVDSELWYYGRYAEKKIAEEVCKSLLNGLVVEVVRSWE